MSEIARVLVLSGNLTFPSLPRRLSLGSLWFRAAGLFQTCPGACVRSNDGVSHTVLFAFSYYGDGVCAKTTQLQSDVPPGRRRSAGLRSVPSGLRRSSLRQVSPLSFWNGTPLTINQTIGFHVPIGCLFVPFAECDLRTRVKLRPLFELFTFA